MKGPPLSMTASASGEDIPATYQLHANSYVAKPVSLDRLFEAVKSIESFRPAAAKLPSRERYEEREH